MITESYIYICVITTQKVGGGNYFLGHRQLKNGGVGKGEE